MFDVVLAIRRLVRSPREIPAIVMTLAIGVGGVCAAWTVLYTVLLEPLPFPEPDQLIRIWNGGGPSGTRSSGRTLSEADFETLRDEHPALESIAIYQPISGLLGTSQLEVPKRRRGLFVSGEFFDVVRQLPSVGRALTREDERLEANPVIVVSERLRTAGVVEGKINELINVDGVAYTIVGLMPDSFFFPDKETDYWIPVVLRDSILAHLAREPGATAPTVSVRYYRALGRLATGTTPAAAASEATAILSSSRDTVIEARSYVDELTEAIRTPLITLQFAALFVLLLACINAAWLFGWRVRRLEPSFAIMSALGATPRRLLGATLIEALTVALLSTPLALLVAWGLIRIFLIYGQGIIPRISEARLAPDAVLLTLVATTIAGVASSFPGSLMVARTARRRGRLRRTDSVSGRQRSQYAAMTLQAGVVFALAMQAVLQSFVLGDLVGSHLGFDERDLIAVELLFSSDGGLDPAVQAARYAQLPRTLEAAGISAATINALPLSGFFTMMSLRLAADRRSTTMVGLRLVSLSYFGLVKARLVRGRLFSTADDGREVVVVNDVLARQLFGGTDAAIGQRVVVGSIWDPESEIVGVVEGVRHRGVLEDVDPELYMPYENAGRLLAAANPRFFLLASTSAGYRTEETIRSVVRAELPEAEIVGMRPFEDLLWQTVGDKPLLTIGVGAFALIAFLLMVAGFHGMIGQALAARSREIAIKLALGATPKRILVESISTSVGVYAAGISVGLGFALILRNTVRRVVFVPPELPEPSLASVGMWAAVIVGLAVVVACYRPVRRATGTDPAVLLRAE